MENAAPADNSPFLCILRPEDYFSNHPVIHTSGAFTQFPAVITWRARLRYQLFSSAGHICPIALQHINIVSLVIWLLPFIKYVTASAFILITPLSLCTFTSPSAPRHHLQSQNHQLLPPPLLMLLWGTYLAASVAQGRSPSIIKSPC